MSTYPQSTGSSKQSAPVEKTIDLFRPPTNEEKLEYVARDAQQLEIAMRQLDNRVAKKLGITIPDGEALLDESAMQRERPRIKLRMQAKKIALEEKFVSRTELVDAQLERSGFKREADFGEDQIPRSLRSAVLKTIERGRLTLLLAIVHDDKEIAQAKGLLARSYALARPAQDFRVEDFAPLIKEDEQAIRSAIASAQMSGMQSDGKTTTSRYL